MLAGHEAPATPHYTAASLGTQCSSEKASSVGSSCGSTASRQETSSNLARVKTDLPSQVARLRRLSSNLTYTDLPGAPQAEPVTPMGNSSSMSVFAPDTPSCFMATGMGKSPAGSAASAACDEAAESEVRSDLGPPNAVDAESTVGCLQAITGCAADNDAEGEENSSVNPPLPDLPDSADGAQGGITSIRYIHIGCAVACLCVFALWARDASAGASLSARMFPT